MKNKSVLILGARSDIARAVAHKFASEGYSIQLAARNSQDLDLVKKDIEIRFGVPVTLHEFDALAWQTHERFVADLPALPEIAVSAVGILGEQSQGEHNFKFAINTIRTNYEGPMSIFSVLANKFISRQSGTLVGISSVAGERGRASNYLYGSAKAGYTAFLSGLRNRLTKDGIHVVTVLPGFVRTQMTARMNLLPILTAEPNEVADAIYWAVIKKKNVIYVKDSWLLIMLIIKNMPEIFFKRLYL